MRPKVAQTVVAESAFNDPTGRRARACARRHRAHRARTRSAGPGLGVRRRPRHQHRDRRSWPASLLAAAISSHRAGIWRESSAIAVLAVVTISFFSLDTAGGSGYLGAFLAGLIVGNMEHLGLAMHDAHEIEMRQFAYNLADLVTLIVFVVLGANIPFDAAGRQPAAGPGRARGAAAGGAAADRAGLPAARPRRRAGSATRSPSCAGRARPG